jgi:hypothetical protein
MNPNISPTTPEYCQLPADAHFAGCLAVGSVFLGNEIPVRTEAKAYDEGPPVSITEENLTNICSANGLIVAQKAWAALKAIPTERILFDIREPGEPEKLYLHKLGSILREQHSQRKPIKWPGLAEGTLYSLNLLTDYLVPAEVESLPEVSVTTKRSEELDDKLVADSKHIANFASNLGVPVSEKIISSTLRRLAASYANKHYDVRMQYLPAGRYRGDDSVVTLKGSAGRYGKSIEGELIGLANLANAVQDAGILTEAKVLPRTHYAFVRYLRALQRQHDMSGEVSQVVPTYSANEQYKPQCLPEEALNSQIASGGLVDFARDPIPMYGLSLEFRRSSLEKMRHIQGKVRTEINVGLYTPLVSLFRQKASETGAGEGLYFSRTANLDFLTDYFASGKKPEDVLSAWYELGELLRFDMEWGPSEGSFPPLDVPRGVAIDKTTFELNDAIEYAASLGVEIDRADVQQSLRAYAGQCGTPIQEEAVPLGQGKDWLCRLPDDLRGPQIFALSRYIKSLHQK